MKDLMNQVYIPYLIENGFYLDNDTKQYSSEGSCFSLSPEKGKGYYWVYTHDNLFSISIMDFVFYEDLFLQCQQPKHLSVNYYDSISGEELKPYKRLFCNCIKGHIGYNTLYQAVYHKNIPIRSTGITIMPEYYEDYLKKKYPGEYKDPHSAFISIDGSNNFLEMVFLLKQIKNFRGSGISAKLYYEGKVSEAMSLIIEKTKQEQISYPFKNLYRQDLDSLASVTTYINDHFAFDITLNHLVKIACMGTTKLKSTFKKVYKCTITEYIQNRRISHAEYLLTNTDLAIHQISHIVGYKNASRFSQLFRKNTGLLPSEYRKLSLSK
ncbi:helix-turn-helix domain-containing protein [Inediibacterium massiliense]|uniref:helix-turn-helix domain-containing protein n=1 Tax=Inediibacterium massiliense TaxID=1658111 RepID=UPI0006B53EFF|nr:AraC family transcriptional regulator [Inediibacterium massiliense]